MACCVEFNQASEAEVIVFKGVQDFNDGPVMNEILSEYYLRKPHGGGFRYYAINYCPFCGMARSQVKQGFIE